MIHCCQRNPPGRERVAPGTIRRAPGLRRDGDRAAWSRPSSQQQRGEQGSGQERPSRKLAIRGVSDDGSPMSCGGDCDCADARPAGSCIRGRVHSAGCAFGGHRTRYVDRAVKSEELSNSQVVNVSCVSSGNHGLRSKSAVGDCEVRNQSQRLACRRGRRVIPVSKINSRDVVLSGRQGGYVEGSDSLRQPEHVPRRAGQERADMQMVLDVNEVAANAERHLISAVLYHCGISKRECSRSHQTMSRF